MSDDTTHHKIIALRSILSKLSESADEYANLYKEIRSLSKTDTAKRIEIADRLTKNMLDMVAQAHLIQCRFFDTMVDSLGEDRTLQLLRDAISEAHKNEAEENDHLRNIMKGHVPWQM
jgi:hypothetical protein